MGFRAEKFGGEHCIKPCVNPPLAHVYVKFLIWDWLGNGVLESCCRFGGVGFGLGIKIIKA